MPKIPNRREQDFSRYDAMEDSVLQDILRSDASKPEGEGSDIEELLYVMELLAKRRAERGESRDPQKAFEEFKKHYDPSNEAVAADEDIDAPVCVVPFPEKRKSTSGWRRRLAVAAAAAVLLVAGVLTAGAAQLDLFEAIAKWTKETFRLGLIEETEDAWNAENTSNATFHDFEELLIEYNVPTVLVPAWLPQEFTLTTTHVEEMPARKVFFAQFCNGEKYITLEIRDLHGSVPTQFEQLDSVLEVYQVGKKTFYIFKNDIQLQAVCNLDNLECWIYGDLSLSEIKQIINSIEKV